MKQNKVLQYGIVKEVANQITSPFTALDKIVKTIGVTQSIAESLKPQVANISNIGVASSISKISPVLTASLNISSRIDWEKLNAYVLIDELEKEGIDPKIIKDLDLEQVSNLIKETKKAELSLAQIIKRTSKLDDELNYETLSNFVNNLKKQIRTLERQELILQMAQEHLNKKQTENNKNIQRSSNSKNPEQQLKDKYKLDNLQIELISLLKKGKTQKEMMKETGCSLSTVKNNLSKIYTKLNAYDESGRGSKFKALEILQNLST